jgi:NAD(P)H-hydrate epimerase
MTTGGTGDVLAGIIAGLMSKKMDAYDAGCLGAYLSGKAGERAFAKFSYGMIATDVIRYIPKAICNGLDRLGI